VFVIHVLYSDMCALTSKNLSVCGYLEGGRHDARVECGGAGLAQHNEKMRSAKYAVCMGDRICIFYF
jgi:hypothetical protein